MIFRCPRCQVQQVVAEHSGDYVHECNSGVAALDDEDKRIIGTWSDYVGSDFTQRTSPGTIAWQNVGNTLMGTEAWVRDNAKNFARSVRGANRQITRIRQHLHYIADVHNVKTPDDPTYKGE